MLSEQVLRAANLGVVGGNNIEELLLKLRIEWSGEFSKVKNIGVGLSGGDFHGKQIECILG